ncbi:hypothetical protein T265_07125 [Opisthorchis viverrini]|uniref:Uncharacterized protein n=1 Tax=Opisthorchis viverrini TaxID=6198 RepID=A0A074ZQ34_OPIVI|nr:hypothetical protein T265_07125 [Opisthorchis viverrini]KER25445.1 hypothetical protein T265_07125 [Opisthorchis viverrini]
MVNLLSPQLREEVKEQIDRNIILGCGQNTFRLSGWINGVDLGVCIDSLEDLYPQGCWPQYGIHDVFGNSASVRLIHPLGGETCIGHPITLRPTIPLAIQLYELAVGYSSKAKRVVCGINKEPIKKLIPTALPVSFPRPPIGYEKLVRSDHSIPLLLGEATPHP